MFDLFSDYLAGAQGGLNGTDARIKVVGAGSIIVGIIASTHPHLPIVFFFMSLAALVLHRIPIRVVLFRLTAPIVAVSMIMLLQTFMIPGRTLWSMNLGTVHLTASHEGIHNGILLGTRVFSAASVVLLLGVTTPAHRLFRALAWFGVPRSWVEIAFLMYRYIFVFLDQTSDTATAQKIRLGYSSNGRALKSLGTLAGTVIIRSIDQAESTHEAMKLRLYTGSLPLAPMRSLKSWEIWLLSGIPFAIASMWGLFEFAV